MQKKMVVARIGVRGVNMISYIYFFFGTPQPDVEVESGTCIGLSLEDKARELVSKALKGPSAHTGGSLAVSNFCHVALLRPYPHQFPLCSGPCRCWCWCIINKDTFNRRDSKGIRR